MKLGIGSDPIGPETDIVVRGDGGEELEERKRSRDTRLLARADDVPTFCRSFLRSFSAGNTHDASMSASNGS